MNWKQLALTVPIVALVTAIAIIKLQSKNNEIQKSHTLKFPLLVSGLRPEGHNYLIPAGTTLYYDEAFPEGFVRYKIYVNVEGIKLNSTETTDKFPIDPISASPLRKEDLAMLLKEYPISKDELKSILDAKILSKEEIREILKEYSE